VSDVPEAVSERMRLVLEETVEQIVPNSRVIVKKHVWRNAKYVGMSGEKVAIWRGWSANLRMLDPRFGAIYIDYAETSNSTSENEQLFGFAFSESIKLINPFIFLFVTSCSIKKQEEIIAACFTFRQINATIHPGIVTSPKEFFDLPLNQWANIGSELLYLQHSICG